MYQIAIQATAIPININGYIHHPNKLFVRFEQAQPDLNDAGRSRPHFYWGTLSRMDDELNYLNSGGEQKIGINISKFKDRLLGAFNIQDSFDTYSQPCLIFGYYKQSKRKAFIDVRQAEHIFIKMDEE